MAIIGCTAWSRNICGNLETLAQSTLQDAAVATSYIFPLGFLILIKAATASRTIGNGSIRDVKAVAVIILSTIVSTLGNAILYIPCQPAAALCCFSVRILSQFTHAIQNVSILFQSASAWAGKFCAFYFEVLILSKLLLTCRVGSRRDF
jgi:hypothetical protein